MNYTIGDFLIRLKNAYMAHRNETNVPYAKTVLAVGKILAEEGYIKEIKDTEVDGRKALLAKLSYTNRMPSLLDVEIISKPSFRVYVTSSETKKLLRNMGTHIISTNEGIVSARTAAKKNLGGELICHVI